MKPSRRAKIICTLGPATSSPEKIRARVDAGMDVARLNFSHGSHADHKQRFGFIRSIEAETGRPIAILLDLQGPKLREGTFAGGRMELEAGARFQLDGGSACAQPRLLSSTSLMPRL